ncbi:MAG TPA: alpha/beta hydrolase [Actinomycetes bacterium]
MQRRGILAFLVIVLLAAGCSGGGSGGRTAGAPATTQAALDGCLRAGEGTLTDLGGGHQAAVLGGGSAGVVLSNQSDENLCAWLPFGRALAAKGFRVLLYDYGAAGEPAQDVALAAGKLRSLGATSVLLVGASEGAKASLVAATTLDPPPAALVSLSAERTLQGADVLPAAAKLQVPVLFVTARDDLVVGDATSQLYKAASKSPARRLEVVAGEAHGTDLLGGAAGAKLQAIVVGFLQAHASAAPATTAARSPVVARCGPPEAPASLVHFKATDGARLDGALVGSGRAGVVLLHEFPNDLCGFWPYAVYLAGKGMRVLDIDLRCFGDSSCPADAKGTVVDDVAGAVAELQRRGAGSVSLVGASGGATTALLAGARLGAKVAAVVSLSGERDPTIVLGASGPPDVAPLLKRLVSPTLMVVASNDPTTSVDETRAMYAAVAARPKRIDVLQGPYDGRHGWDMLTEAGGGQSWSPLAAQVAAFLCAHAG